MTEKDILKQVNIYLDILQEERQQGRASYEQIKFQDTIQGLLNLYNKEKENYNKIFENVEETTLYADGKEIHKLIELTDFISKDKIREYKKAYEQKREQEIKELGMSMLGSAIDVLEELLGE